MSRFDDHMRKEDFHRLVPQTVATQVAGQMFFCAMLKKFVATVAEVELNSTFCNGSRKVARYVTLGNDSCNLSRNGVARQVARKIAL